MSYVDLHMHSKYSDGKLSPQEIVEYATENNIEVISITDHNTLDAYFQEVSLSNIKLVPGVEIDINYSPEIQVLCYNFDERNSDLLNVLKYIQIKRMQAKVKLVRSLLKMQIIDKSDLTEVCKLNDFDHICRYLETKIEGKTKSEIKSEYFSKGKVLYQEIPSLELDDCIKLVHNAGGIVVLAHPGRIHIASDKIDSLFEELLIRGVDGIECYHPDNNETLSQSIIAFSKEHKCLITGGSDLHSIDTDFRVSDDSVTKIWED